MKDKYYTPEAGELTIGMEVELLHSTNGWVKYINPDIKPLDANSLKEGVRVKFLDREDIESLGFNRIEECENYNNNESTYQKRVSDDEIYCLVFHYDINKVTISVHDKDIKTNMSVERKFQGTLKNKSELKQVLKMIGI